MIESVSSRNPLCRQMRLYLAWLCVLAVWHFGLSQLRAEAGDTEHQIKAAFLFNFAQFVEWPPGAFTNAQAPLCIGVLGNDPFGSSLEETVHDETIRGRKLAIQHSRKIEDLKNCQMIFISRSEKSKVDEILAALDSRPVLTVGEIDGFAQRGGAINFYREGKKVRFEINPAVTRRNGLKVSSELLSLGKIVNEETGGKK